MDRMKAEGEMAPDGQNLCVSKDIACAVRWFLNFDIVETWQSPPPPVFPVLVILIKLKKIINNDNLRFFFIIMKGNSVKLEKERINYQYTHNE